MGTQSCSLCSLKLEQLNQLVSRVSKKVLWRVHHRRAVSMLFLDMLLYFLSPRGSCLGGSLTADWLGWPVVRELLHISVHFIFHSAVSSVHWMRALYFGLALRSFAQGLVARVWCFAFGFHAFSCCHSSLPVKLFHFQFSAFSALAFSFHFNFNYFQASAQTWIVVCRSCVSCPFSM